MKDLICYCFEYSADDIRIDVRANNGRSTILEKIVAAKKAGGCQCATTHPEGRGCLTDVRRVVDQAISQHGL